MSKITKADCKPFAYSSPQASFQTPDFNGAQIPTAKLSSDQQQNVLTHHKFSKSDEFNYSPSTEQQQQ